MKITKQQLKQIIREELSNYLNEEDPVMGQGKSLADLIEDSALIWGVRENVQKNPLGAWAQLINEISKQWKTARNMLFGCRREPESVECQTFAVIQDYINNTLLPFTEEPGELLDLPASRTTRRWIRKNYMKLKDSMKYVPPSKKLDDILQTKAWKEALKKGGGEYGEEFDL